VLSCLQSKVRRPQEQSLKDEPKSIFAPGRISSPMTLKDAVLNVTQTNALTRPEIVDAVRALGFTFHTKSPLNSVNMVVYGKSPKFVNDAGFVALKSRSGD
jgi:hypothetical protein